MDDDQGLSDAITYIPILLGLMKENGGQIPSKGFFAGCEELKNNEAALKEHILKKGMFAACIKELTSKKGSSEILFNGCTFLGNLSMGSDDRKTRLVSDGCIDYCIMAMKQHKQDAGLQVAGCRLLGNLAAWKKDAAQKVFKAGGGEAAVEAMDSHAKDANVQTSACWTVCKLTDQIQKDFAKKFSQGKGIDATIKAMDTHAFNERVQGYGCALLCSLIKAYPKLHPRIMETKGCSNAMHRIGAFSRTREGCVKVVMAGGVGLAINTARQLQAEPDVVCSCLNLLTNLVKDSTKFGERVSQEGGVAMCVDVMGMMKDDVSVQIAGCIFLAGAANSDYMGPTLANQGAIQIICKALVNHRDNADLQHKGFKALNNMAANKGDIKQKLMDEGVLKLCVGALQAFKSDVSVQEEGILVLATLARGSRERSQFVTSAGGISLAIKGMQACRGQLSVCESGLNLLLAMAQMEDLQRSNLLMMEGAVQAVFGAMAMCGRDQRIKLWSAQIMGLLAKSSVENAAKIRSEWAMIQGRDEKVCRCCGVTADEKGIKMLKCGECTIGPSFCSQECWKDYYHEHQAECRANPIAPPDQETYLAPVYREQRKKTNFK